MRSEAFFDTNVLLYIPSDDAKRSERARQLLREGGVISMQVLNEMASVMARKIGLPWPTIRELLTVMRQSVRVTPTDLSTHDLGVDLAERYRFSVYDSMLLAAALQAGCTTFYSEDMHDGQIIEGRLTIRNPFA